MRVQLRDGLAEDAVVPGVEQADAVGADEGGAVAVDGVQDALFQQCPLVGFLPESGRQDDEGFYSFS